MLAANHWTENGVPSGGVRKRTKGAEGFARSRRELSPFLNGDSIQVRCSKFPGIMADQSGFSTRGIRFNKAYKNVAPRVVTPRV